MKFNPMFYSINPSRYYYFRNLHISEALNSITYVFFVIFVIPLFLLFFYFKLSLVNQTKTNDIQLNLNITIELITFIRMN